MTPGVAQSYASALVDHVDGGGPHTPATHDCPAAHARPQSPQCMTLVLTSTHEAPHIRCPEGQPQTPMLQLPAQVVPHRPQFCASDATSVHTSPQFMASAAHAGATTANEHRHMPYVFDVTPLRDEPT